MKTKRDRQAEREASAFALALLMPDFLFKKDMEACPLSFTDDAPLKELAKKYGVTMTAAAVRYCQLFKTLKDGQT